MAVKIFISYRRDDSASYAGRVHDRLMHEFGRDFLFMDVDAIPLGANFTQVLDEEVSKCDVLLAIIGPRWVDAKDDTGQLRLDNPQDFVKIEIATALKRRVTVIPILLDGTRMPKASELPVDLRDLAHFNALDVRHASFHSDMEKLIRALRRSGVQMQRPVSAPADIEYHRSTNPGVHSVSNNQIEPVDVENSRSTDAAKVVDEAKRNVQQVAPWAKSSAVTNVPYVSEMERARRIILLPSPAAPNQTNRSVLDLLQDTITRRIIDTSNSILGLSDAKSIPTIAAASTSILAGLLQKADKTSVMANVVALIRETSPDGIEISLSSLLSSGDSGCAGQVKGNRMTSLVYSSEAAFAVRAVADANGVKSAAAAKIISLSSLMVLVVLRTKLGSNPKAADLVKLLISEKNLLIQAMSPSMRKFHRLA